MDEVRFDIDLVVTQRSGARVRTWAVSFGAEVPARYETLDAALAACLYQAEVELRRRPRVHRATITIPLPGGPRAELYCAPQRARPRAPRSTRSYGATAAPGVSTTT